IDAGKKDPSGFRIGRSRQRGVTCLHLGSPPRRRKGESENADVRRPIGPVVEVMGVSLAADAAGFDFPAWGAAVRNFQASDDRAFPKSDVNVCSLITCGKIDLIVAEGKGTGDGS